MLYRSSSSSLPLLSNALAFVAHSAFPRRTICTSHCAFTAFDPRVFTDPIVTIGELNKILPPDDKRNFMYIIPMKSDQTPVFYRDAIVDKMVRVFLIEGKKEISHNNILLALEIVKRTQYGKWLNEKDEKKRAEIILDPIEVANRAILNCRPLMKLEKTIRAGTLYLVPMPISEKVAIFKAMKMMRDICRVKAGKNRGEKRAHYPHFKDVLASELLAAMDNEGMTIQAKQELHKMCEQNRSYSSMKRF
uniref:Ribosomal_S7 domain-containing protein n=1 Tax=Globodera pallida TaxID=36090 RepID=A0A183BXS6_GLOPA